MKAFLKKEPFLTAILASKSRNFEVNFENRYLFTFASSKNVSEIVRSWELVRSKDMGQGNILDAFNNFVRPRENFLERFKAKAFLKKEPFLTAILSSKSRNFEVNFENR